MINFLKKRTKVYLAILDSEIGGFTQRIVVGCADEADAVQYINKTKESHESIKEITVLDQRLRQALYC